LLQYVYTARADAGAAGRDEGWSDSEGQEISSTLLPVPEALRAIADDPVAVAFVKSLGRVRT
jgi:hypothetical protein